jgi:peptidyl-prolyl cis-trans isomerase SurA
MNKLSLAVALTLLGMAAASVQAQAPSFRSSTAIANPQVASPKGDAIVAVVNQEIITRTDVQRRVLRIQRDLVQKGQSLPPVAELEKTALDAIVDEKVQVSAAREAGISVDENTLDRAMQQIAQSNNMRLPEFMARVEAEGYGIVGYRENIREEITISRLRERDIASRLRISESDIDSFIAEQAGVSSGDRNEINVAHLLVAVPERASDAERAALRAKAVRLAEQARSGTDFVALAQDSDATNAKLGGEFGWRNPQRYPQAFADAVASLKTGAVTDPIQTGAGFHVLKLLGRRQAELPAAAVTATRARHIVLREGNEAENTRRLVEMKQQIAAGTAKFEDLAKRFSQDGAAAQGGDLGFMLPRQLVPEFEVAMNNLAPGQLSDPIPTRFGVHLVQVLERKQQALSTKETRDQAREVLRERKGEENTVAWLQDLRARAYVEMRSDK